MHAGIAGGAAPPRGGVDHTLDQICLEKDNLLKCFLNLFVIIIIVVFVVAFIIISIVTGVCGVMSPAGGALCFSERKQNCEAQTSLRM